MYVCLCGMSREMDVGREERERVERSKVKGTKIEKVSRVGGAECAYSEDNVHSAPHSAARVGALNIALTLNGGVG